MRLSLRFLVPLFAALALLAYIVVPQVDALTVRWFVRDLDSRAQLAAAPLADQLGELVSQQAPGRITTLLNSVTQNQRLYAIAYCDPSDKIAYRSANLPSQLGCEMGEDEHKVGTSTGDVSGSILRLPDGSLHIARIPVRTADGAVGKLVMVSDMSFIESRSEATRKYTILLFLVLGVVTSLITVLVAHLSWRGWIAGVRAMLRGEGVLRPFSGVQTSNVADSAGFDPELRPLMSDLRSILREVDEDRRLRDVASDDGGEWTPERLRTLLKDHLSDDEIIVVSNREPYIHVKTDHGIEVNCPASGLVTAVEPVMRACSGTWIAHGAGSADRETVDAKDHVAVPPKDPSYTLRRIWLSQEEEEGYYYGFANEGLWPLCHIAHVRPVFRSADWKQYVAVNRRFADAVIAEARTENPVVLIQDYHFALLPRLIRDRLPHATIITFWHIPWPNPESFGICPWRTELLEGLLGSTILGFHTRYQAKNFIETADRFLETRIEHETSLISYGGARTQVESYPISIDWPDAPSLGKTVDECRREVRERLGVPATQLLGIGVDRLDYTKGILERFSAVEAMFERHPEMIGRFTFVQIAAPSRSALEEYQNFEARVRSEALRINRRFARPAAMRPNGDAYIAIALLIEHHDKASVFTHYRACDVCVVTSLHDGMNLVAKEFVAARDDEQGVLILSAFAGASRELREALIVNPYHVEHTADMIHAGLTMPPAEQRERMRAMRALVRDHNVYRWAARMLLDASRLRQRERIRARIAEHHSEAEDRGRWRRAAA
ncbi:MAG: trehalose-6-phosphate synthase [Burkholderiaceae bacterium]